MFIGLKILYVIQNKCHWLKNTSFTVVGNFIYRPSVQSNGVKIDGTRLMEPDGTENVGTEPKLCGTCTYIFL